MDRSAAAMPTCVLVRLSELSDGEFVSHRLRLRDGLVLQLSRKPRMARGFHGLACAPLTQRQNDNEDLKQLADLFAIALLTGKMIT